MSEATVWPSGYCQENPSEIPTGDFRGRGGLWQIQPGKSNQTKKQINHFFNIFLVSMSGLVSPFYRKPPTGVSEGVSGEFPPGHHCWATRYNLNLNLLYYECPINFFSRFKSRLFDSSNTFEFRRDIFVNIIYIYCWQLDSY
jgi:hypothetical protein